MEAAAFPFYISDVGCTVQGSEDPGGQIWQWEEAGMWA